VSRLAAFAGLWALAAVALMALSLPLVAAGTIGTLILGAAWRAGKGAGAGLVAGSLVLAAVAVELAARMAGEAAVYYRPEEKLYAAEDRLHFKPGAREVGFAMPHGDLVAIAGRDLPAIAQPRRIDFVTDRLGYRNAADYAGQRWVTVGDSFAVGSGNTQDEILAAQLSRRLGEGVYNASYPTDPEGYVRILERLAEAEPGPWRAAVLLFEGNDFVCSGEAESWLRPWYAYVPGEIRKLKGYRLAFGLTRGAQARVMAWFGAGQVSVIEIAGRPAGLHLLYDRRVRRTSGCDWSDLVPLYRQIAPRVAVLVFVPYLTRLYAPDRDRLPNVALDFVHRLGRDSGIAVLDLTPAMVAAADRALPELLYWRDDSHWNPAGIAAAAEAIAARLQ